MLRRPGHGPSTSENNLPPPAIADQPHPAPRPAASTPAWWQTSGMVANQRHVGAPNAADNAAGHSRLSWVTAPPAITGRPSNAPA